MIPKLPACLLAFVLTFTSVSAQNLEQVAYKYSGVVEAAELQVDETQRIQRSGRLFDTGIARRGTSLAAALFRALSSQNNIELDYSPAEEMHAYLRHPDAAPSNESVLFRRAGRLYEQATSIKGDGFDLQVDWMNLEWRVRIKLSALLD